jgi:hypothetical protein
MIQTLEAIVDETGKIRLLSEVRLEKSRRALVTILDEEPKVSVESNVQMPTNEAVSDDEVLGVWADREKEAQEIASEIRERNRKTT